MSKISKSEKETILHTTEAEDTWSVYTFNTVLQKKLAAFAEQYPELCRQKSNDNETGSVTYEMVKSRIFIRLIPPYSEERRRAASEYAKAQRSGTGKEG